MLSEVLVIAALAMALAGAIPRNRPRPGRRAWWVLALLGIGHAAMSVLAAVGIYVGAVAAGAYLEGPPPPAAPPAVRGCGPVRDA
ncbi:hypothetical protein [Methylobacterium sp. yr596]|uniref:hypothetical protein n=1 Tax=Methylobacterium sp. yr596 TaxID=1761800 RepID=UPI0008EBBF71|nr:hypothetical protein [Methylobacterium sp. yr596]SFE90454.1 hypothetical protein SAMN04487844_107139 [Methylobacterium sp. yr596]